MHINLTRQRLRVGDYAVDVRRTGAATSPPVILVHGIGVSGTYYIPLARELAQTYDVHILDLPGYGKTPKPKQPLNIPELAAVIRQYSQLMKLGQTILIGQSMGCQIVAELAQTAEADVAKVILFGPTVNTNERTRFHQTKRLLLDGLQEPWRMQKIQMADYMHMGLMRYLQTTTHMLDNHIEDNLSKLHLPILIIRGGKDPIATREWLQHLKAISHDAELAEIPGAPHNAHFTNPQEAAQLCVDFLAG